MIKYIQIGLVFITFVFTIDLKNEAAARMFDPDNFMMVVLGNRDSCTTFLEQFENVEYYEQTEELR